MRVKKEDLVCAVIMSCNLMGEFRKSIIYSIYEVAGEVIVENSDDYRVFTYRSVEEAIRGVLGSDGDYGVRFEVRMIENENKPELDFMKVVREGFKSGDTLIDRELEKNEFPRCGLGAGTGKEMRGF